MSAEMFSAQPSEYSKDKIQCLNLPSSLHIKNFNNKEPSQQ